MSDFRYTFNIDQFLNNKVDVVKFTDEIQASTITIAVDYVTSGNMICDCYFKAPLATDEVTTLSGLVSVHDGVSYVEEETQPVNIVQSDVHVQTDLTDELRDRSGKLRVHQTSRKLGTMIMWTGEGDDQSDPHHVGDGESLSFAYEAGQTEPLIKYIDFNIVDNETWLHEGYVTWENAQLDTLDLALVPRTTGITITSGTNYALHDYLIVPAVPGTGNVQLTTDISEHNGGLVYMPKNDLGVRAMAFWDAEWDTTTKKYINIAPNLTGQGEYNLFASEVTFAHFVRKMNLINAGFIALNSSDTDQLGHGMRLKMIADVNTVVAGDHNWRVACTLCLHRKKSTNGMMI